MIFQSPILYTDFYKVGHHTMYPPGSEYIYSNFTARYSRVPDLDKVVVFGVQYFVKEFLIDQFNTFFFRQPKDEILGAYEELMNNALGPDNGVGTAHLSALHDLGYLPIHVKALPEGTVCPLRVPVLTITNTKPEFFWLTNFLETLLSNVLWHPMTSATIAHAYRKVLDQYALETSDMPEFVDWQAHDFSMRGQTSLESAVTSGAAHLLSFKGTDTVPAIPFLGNYYSGFSSGFIGGSVAATEHSVMCMGGNETEIETFRRLLKRNGIISIVSDTWDYWKVITDTLPTLHGFIMNREGKLVIRPDSGDPVKILCGDPSPVASAAEAAGTVELLWRIFGGTLNSKGYKQLDPHIGVIYGDSITLERCKEICRQLKDKGFASTNVVFGVGSYTYQHVTRDTLGFAMKATWGQINGEAVELYKSPKTDNGVKYSAKGLLRVNEDLTLKEQCTKEEEGGGLLRTVFLDGKSDLDETLETIRGRLRAAT